MISFFLEKHYPGHKRKATTTSLSLPFIRLNELYRDCVGLILSLSSLLLFFVPSEIFVVSLLGCPGNILPRFFRSIAPRES